jgi:ActR/RegA family two-component response regulator
MRRILLAEDDASNRLTLEALIEDEGFAVVAADSYATALASVRDGGGAYALGVFDLDLGDGDGLDLVEPFRERFPRASVVILSGGSLERCAGVDAVLTKGNGLPVLIAMLRALPSCS